MLKYLQKRILYGPAQEVLWYFSGLIVQHMLGLLAVKSCFVWKFLGAQFFFNLYMTLMIFIITLDMPKYVQKGMF